ncbi:flagellar hook-associated protein 1 [Virgisporangium aliadipatigenens]|uniref:Flagellar hook-associated protein 1 n=1 Tax=Virgisporangium aliadipatigenens TaxID=741659 RepID=A0A8J3YW16_9ACTN|nr:flagellar hook-associated protein FlgK [Virgisporangium aliadipatigenens]GIJ50841.1 flagellar hook-associated protein 1 [Virgisporangium aliadipatigenens]
MSTFNGLSTALTSLYANRRGMEVTAHNIANVNTPGYTRQRANLQAIAGPAIPGLTSQASPVGDGVMVESVQRLRDIFLESRGRIEHAAAEYLGTQQIQLGRIEQAFAEPSDEALQAQLDEMWASFSDLSLRPNSTAARSSVVSRATIVADTIRGNGDQLSTQWDTALTELNAMILDVNSTTAAVAQLNEGIMAATAVGQQPNDLMDQRDALVMKLAELTGARGVPRDNGVTDVLLNGSVLVSGNHSRTISPATGAANLNDVKAGGAVALQFNEPPANPSASPDSGKLAGMLETLNRTIRTYSDGLDRVANELITSVNAQHALGRDADGDMGGAFFSGTNASDIGVAVVDPDDIAAADAASASGPLDGANAQEIAKLANKKDGANEKYRQLIVDLGVAAQTVNRRVEIQAGVVTQSDAEREGDAGVSLDEEMTNMVQYERAYQAAARVISTIDTMLDTLINGMGR